MRTSLTFFRVLLASSGQPKILRPEHESGARNHCATPVESPRAWQHRGLAITEPEDNTREGKKTNTSPAQRVRRETLELGLTLFLLLSAGGLCAWSLAELVGAIKLLDATILLDATNQGVSTPQMQPFEWPHR